MQRPVRGFRELELCARAGALSWLTAADPRPSPQVLGDVSNAPPAGRAPAKQGSGGGGGIGAADTATAGEPAAPASLLAPGGSAGAADRIHIAAGRLLAARRLQSATAAAEQAAVAEDAALLVSAERAGARPEALHAAAQAARRAAEARHSAAEDGARTA